MTKQKQMILSTAEDAEEVFEARAESFGKTDFFLSTPSLIAYRI